MINNNQISVMDNKQDLSLLKKNMDRNFGKNYKDYVHCKATTFMDNM